MNVFAVSAPTPVDNRLPALQEQLLAAAIYATAIRTHLSQVCSADERDALIEQQDRAETLRQVLERQVAKLERTCEPW